MNQWDTDWVSYLWNPFRVLIALTWIISFKWIKEIIACLLETSWMQASSPMYLEVKYSKLVCIVDCIYCVVYSYIYIYIFIYLFIYVFSLWCFIHSFFPASQENTVTSERDTVALLLLLYEMSARQRETDSHVIHVVRPGTLALLSGFTYIST